MYIVTVLLRFFQLLSALVVMGVSISLAKGQVAGVVPTRTGFDAAAGALGALAAITGLIALFFEKIPQRMTWGLDGLTALAFLAGGIASALGLRGTNCSDWNTLRNNALLNGGPVKGDPYGRGVYWDWDSKSRNDLNERCRSYTADAAFLFLGCIVTVIILVWTYTKRSKSRGGSYV